MSSFIVSSNISQPLILRDQDLADNQPAKSSYSLNETLNVLILLVSYVHDYTWSLVAHVDGVMMHLEELLVQDRPGTGSRLYISTQINYVTGLMTASINIVMNLQSDTYII